MSSIDLTIEVELPDFEVFGLVRPYLASAVFADGSRAVIDGWTVLDGETCEEAMQRTAQEMDAVRAEIEVIPL